jgi:hypothetical protein
MSEIKLEVGKFYRQRDGEKCQVIGIDTWSGNLAKGEYLVLWPCGTIDRLYEGGKYQIGREDPADIVAEWREPVTLNGWINIYPDQIRGVYESRHAADKFNRSITAKLGYDYRTACVYVSGTEGVEP